MAKILLLNGPNLNLLGTREPGLYGVTGLEQIEAAARAQAQERGHSLSALQSNSESELVDRIHQAAKESVAFILLNPAAFTHTSIALRDALLAAEIPFIEIHLSNLAGREDFRQRSYFSDIAVGYISGLGALGYRLAMEAAISLLEIDKKKQ